MTSLCDSFRSIAFQTWRKMGQARGVHHQPLEETFTDLNLLSLRLSNPQELFTVQFTKPQEGCNGADWEWWFVDSAVQTGFPVRIQAKVLNLVTDCFEHIHYKQKSGAYQCDLLEQQAVNSGMIPLYCLYLHKDGLSEPPNACGSYAYAPESFGCSIVPTSHVRALRASGETGINAVLQEATPWHCLVCCRGYSEGSLPERVAAMLAGRGFFDTREEGDESLLWPRRELPHYVSAVGHGDKAPLPEDPTLRGVVIVREADGN